MQWSQSCNGTPVVGNGHWRFSDASSDVHILSFTPCCNLLFYTAWFFIVVFHVLSTSRERYEEPWRGSSEDDSCRWLSDIGLTCPVDSPGTRHLSICMESQSWVPALGRRSQMAIWRRKWLGSRPGWYTSIALFSRFNRSPYNLNSCIEDGRSCGLAALLTPSLV